MSRRRLGMVFWAEAILCGMAALLGLVTVMWHDWIEVVLRVDPDHGGGVAEWIAVVALLVAGAGAGALARRQWRSRRGWVGQAQPALISRGH